MGYENGVYGNFAAVFAPDIKSGIGSTGDKISEFFQTFQQKMSTLMADMADDSKEELDIDGKKYLKGSLALTYALPDMYSKYEFAFSSMMESLKVEMNLENTLNRSISG